MKKLALASLLILTSCGKPYTIVDQIKPPALPEKYTQAEQLPEIKSTSMSDLILDGVATDQKYNALASKYNDLRSFYLCVKKSIEERNGFCQ